MGFISVSVGGEGDVALPFRVLGCLDLPLILQAGSSQNCRFSMGLEFVDLYLYDA